MTADHFGPLARALKELAYERRSGRSDVPAADRIVTVDHNRPQYAATVEAVEETERQLRETNVEIDPDEKEQRLAELSAGRRLLNSVRARIAAIATVLGGVLIWAIQSFTSAGFSLAAKAAWERLVELIPH